MRGATGDVAAAERQLNAIEDLLSRSCRAAVGSGLALTAASASTRPPNVRGASLLRSRKALSNPSVHRARSRGASVLRLTHAHAAALHARRSTPKGVSRRRSACGSSPARWRRCSDGSRSRRLDRLDAGQDGLLPRLQLSTARCPCPAPAAPPPPAPSSPDVRMCSPLAQRRSACTRRTPEPPRRLPPPRARPRRKGASRGPSPQPSPPPPLRRPTPPPPKPPPTDAQPQRAALPHRPLHPPRRRPPPGPPYPRVPALGRKQTSPPGDASAGHPRAS